ncbi:MAG: hypothetical protein ACM3ZV_13215 [Bacillota bacterium]
MGRLALGCGSIAVPVAGIALGIAFCFHQERSARAERELAAITDRSPVRPPFLRDAATCETSPESERLDRAMIEVARAAAPLGGDQQSPVVGYVTAYFGWHWRITGKLGSRRCAPDQVLIDELGPWLDALRWPAVNTERNSLQLAERLPRSVIRARGLAAIAFLRFPPPQDLKFYDSRPLAMQLLADQGPLARPWHAAAMARMDGASAIGTGAAQVAVASDAASALPRVSQLMSDTLARARRVKASSDGRDVAVLDGRDGNRLIELGYAIARGGRAAQPYAQPVIAMLDQRIARSAPPFGLFATPPTEFCRIAKAIGGTAAAAADRRPFCAPGFKGGDGGPSPY